jgi:hypothetical protein
MPNTIIFTYNTQGGADANPAYSQPYFSSQAEKVSSIDTV